MSNLFYSSVTGTAAQAHAATANFWSTLAPQISNDVEMVVEGDVFIIDDATGIIGGVAAVPPVTIAGGNAGAEAPLATQGLIQTLTGVYAGGRQLRGRIFVWGVPSSACVAGSPTTGYRGVLDTAAANLLAAPGADLVVYSRAGGLSVPVTVARTWTEFAVLRSRRD